MPHITASDIQGMPLVEAIQLLEAMGLVQYTEVPRSPNLSLIDYAKTGAIKNFSIFGEVTPITIFEVVHNYHEHAEFPPDGMFGLLASRFGPENSDKDLLSTLIYSMADAMKADAIALVQEVWYLNEEDAPEIQKLAEKDNISTAEAFRQLFPGGVASSDHRKEAVMIIHETPNHIERHRADIVTDEHGKRSLADWTTSSVIGMSRRFMRPTPSFDNTHKN